MAFGKPPLDVAEQALMEEDFQVDQIRARMIGGRTIACGCVVRGETRFAQQILQRCSKHSNSEGSE